jgi:hypothetical protein
MCRGRSGIFSKIRKLGRKILKKNQESIKESVIVKFFSSVGGGGGWKIQKWRIPSKIKKISVYFNI